jgi:hypothetical protein
MHQIGRHGLLRIDRSSWDRALIALVMICLSIACRATNATETRYVIGQTAEVDGWRITVHGFTLLSAEGGHTPGRDRVFCAVEVTVANASNHIRYVMLERQMLLLDAGGHTYAVDQDAGVVAARTRQWLPPDGEFVPGWSSHGSAAYSIPVAGGEWQWVFRAGLFPWSHRVVFAIGLPTP